MAATTGFKTDLAPPIVIVHPTTGPTADNVAPIGTFWLKVVGPVLFCATGQGAGGTTTTWTQLRP